MSNATSTVLAALREQRPGLLLDVPSGGGPITRGARDLGWRIVEVDLFPRADLAGVQADACAPLPFRDACFDALVSMEGIEHFENQTGFVRECARVLKPGGTMILSTPNILHLSSRVSGFLTGQRLMKHGFINEHSTLRERMGTRLYHGHAYLIDAFRLRYILRVVGLELVELRASSVSVSSALMSPLYGAVWAATSFAIASGRKHVESKGKPPPPRSVERELTSVALSPAVLFGKKLVAIARKTS